MKLFESIVDDGKNVFKALGTGKNKKAFLNVYGGNGEFIKIKDVTKDYLNELSIDKLNEDLYKAGWGEAERLMICALVEEHILSRK